MPRNKRVVTQPQKKKQWSEKEILDILDKVFIELETDPDAFYVQYLVIQKGLSKQVLSEWRNDSPAIKSRYAELKELSEHKVANEMLKSRSKVNTVASIFVLKSSFGWIEAEKNKNLQIQEAQLQTENKKIKIGFTDEGESHGDSDQS